MRTRNYCILGLALAGLIVITAGCEPDPVGPTPTNVSAYDRMGRADRQRYTDDFIVDYNITRVLNDELLPKERQDSMALVGKVGTTDQMSLSNLATLERDPKAPQQLKRDVLLFLLRRNYPDLGARITGVLQNPKQDPEVYQAALAYVGSNPDSSMLPSIVRKWAQEKEVKGPTEDSYRNAVKQISDQSWEVTLFNALNDKSFPAKGEAMSILRGRIPRRQLKERLENTRAESDTMKALQTFAEVFDYLPETPESLITATIVYKVRQDMLPDAAKMSIDWSKNYRYQFDIRDFHLLSRLARDPLRSNLKRTQLVLEIGQALKTRKHVRHSAADGCNDSFWLQVDKLTMSDLWNLYLLNEMLRRPRVQVALRLMAEGDLADPKSAWGGLVFYQNGQAEAVYYPADPNAGINDLEYQPTQRLMTDGRDSLCRFIGHFEKIENADRAGPTAIELANAKSGNYYGLVLTRTDKDSFAAHYYNPQGQVVSLGKFSLR